jgi:hypothetical protein
MIAALVITNIVTLFELQVTVAKPEVYTFN